VHFIISDRRRRCLSTAAAAAAAKGANQHWTLWRVVTAAFLANNCSASASRELSVFYDSRRSLVGLPISRPLSRPAGS